MGAVFAIIAFTTTIGYITYSMNVLDNFSQVTLSKNQEVADRDKEQFDVTGFAITNNKFNITVQDTGNLPVKFTRLWVENKTITDWVSKFDISKSVSPGATLTNIGQDIQLNVLTTKSYDVKLVTERGNVKEFTVNSASLQPLDLKIYVLPGVINTGFATTVLFTVTNNMTNNGIMTNLQPTMLIIPEGASAEQLSGPYPVSYPVLERGDTAYFKWTYKITGNAGDKAKFEASLVGGYAGQVVDGEVEVATVSLADSSNTSLESKGLGATLSSDDILFLHKETTDALDGYEMQSLYSDNNVGQIIQLDTTSVSFYTLNQTQLIQIPNGTWNGYLRYVSNSLPSTLVNNAASMIFHFEDMGSSTIAKDSTGNNDLTLGTGNNKPVVYSTIGPNGSGTFHFDSSKNQYMYHSITSNVNDINTQASTSGWFKTDPSSPSRMVILRMGDQTDTQEFYEVGLTSGNVLFRYSSKPGLIDGSCQTSGTNYANSAWHHFVALKTGTSTCQLYIDGQLKVTDSDTSCPGSGSCADVAPAGNWNIGRDPSSSGINPFNGYLDDIIHWNSYQLTSTQITDLYKTSYGNNAHQVTFTIQKVDQNGNNPVNIVTSSSYPLQFLDAFGGFSNPADSSFGHYNYTTNVGNVAINSNERLKIKMNFNHPSNGDISIKLKLDDSDVVSDKGNTFFQIPIPSTPFPSYYVYDNSGRGDVNIFNSGPKGAWISFLSRVIYTSLDTGKSYGALLDKVNGIDINTAQDSPLFAVGITQTGSYNKPYSQPGAASSELIPEGRYRMYVFLSGYDDTGTIFLKTINIGVVKVI